MEKLERIVEKIDWKILIGILVALVIVVTVEIGFVLLSFSNTAPSQTASNFSRSTTPTPTSLPQIGYKEFSNKKYSLSYPETWNAEKVQTNRGEAYLFFNKAYFKNGQYYPILSVLSYPITSSRSALLNATFTRNTEFTEEPCSMNISPCYRFSGDVRYSKSDLKLHELVTFFDKGGNTYDVTLRVLYEDNDPSYPIIYQHILSTLNVY